MSLSVAKIDSKIERSIEAKIELACHCKFSA